METIKLKILDEAGHTLMTCDADTAVSLVYTNCYKPGDRVALEIDHPGQYCVIQFEDTMPEALVYVVKREINFHIPFGEQAITYSPKSFAGSHHVIRARLALPEEIAARRNLAFNCYDEHGDTGFYPHASANVETRGEAVSREALVQAALQEITQNYREASLSNVARSYGVSLAYVSECVRAQTGKTYKELLQKHRMETAARLLRRSDLNIQQIITQVGYENTSYFYRLFHERYGQSPREYRRARSQRT